MDWKMRLSRYRPNAMSVVNEPVEDVIGQRGISVLNALRPGDPQNLLHGCRISVSMYGSS